MQEKRHGRSPFGEEILRDEREYAPEKREGQGNRLAVVAHFPISVNQALGYWTGTETVIAT
jgi:hypothetical protein